MHRIAGDTLRVTLAALLLALAAAASAADVPAQVVLLDGSGLSWQQARRIIEANGGEVHHVLPPSVIVASVPATAELVLEQQAATTSTPGAASAGAPRVVRGRAEAEALLAGGAAVSSAAGATLSAEASAALRLLAPQPVPAASDPTLRVTADGRVEVLPLTAWEEPPLIGPKFDARSQAGTNAIGNTFYNTSDFLAGDVGVAILRPESTGALEARVESWTAAEVSYSLTQIVAALDKLRNDSPRGKLTFVYRSESFGPGVAGTVSCDYEAILHANWDSNVVLNVLGKLGYTTQTTSYARLHEWVNDVRTDLGTDWAYGVIVVDNSVTGGGRASAYITGPAGWLFANYTPTVYHHEMGHIWGATDEYHPDAAQSPTALVGYTQEVNANSQYADGTGYYSGAGEGIDALMINNVDYVSPWTRGQWGTWDLDGDGVNETQDTAPALTLPAPTGTSQLTFAGTASATPLKYETGSYAATDITVNRISRVEWRLDGGPWQDASAGDGLFNSSAESFTFTTAGLKNGAYLFEARATDNFGNVTLRPARRSVTVAGSAVANNAPQPALAAVRTAGSTATLFQFSAAGSLDSEDGATLQYRWDYEGDGVWDTGLSSATDATHTYAAGSYVAVVEVRDSAGLAATRRQPVTVAAANLAPAASFVVNRGAAFGTAPVVFNFDAGGSTDGEDAAAALQVRWDFEDDGTWDTAFSTTKTAAHDYAQGHVANPKLETSASLVYYYGTNGFAQSFVAAGTSIGLAELNLRHYSDATPGGTVTVGIRSAVNGAFLTSVVRNQADLKEGAWNTFDFPDVGVTSGATYFLVLVASDLDIMGLVDTANGYAGGMRYYTPDGANWYSNAAHDYLFRIYDAALTTVPLTKSAAWRVRLEVKDANGQTAQTVRDVWTNAYDTPPTVSLASSAASGPVGTTFNLTATGADANSAAAWDGLLHYRWDADADGNFETEFAAGNTRSVTLNEPGVYDAVVEVRDRYHATARASVRLTVGTTVSVNDVTLTEGNAGTTTASFTVSLSGAIGQPVSVGWSTANGSATAGSDYVAASGTATIPAGSTSQTIPVTVNGDLLDETNETFTVTLSSPTNATIADGTGVATINDDDPPPALSVNDVALAEGNAGTKTATFTATLSAPSGLLVSVPWATANGSATTADADYVAASGTLTFNPGVTSATASVTVNGDTKYETNETFVVNLGAPTNATVSDGQGVGTISNDDALPSLSISDVSLAEGNAGTKTATFTATLSAASGVSASVGWATADGSATSADGDYVAASGTLTFNPGVTSATASVTVNGDTKYETNETFVVNLGAATNATVSDAQGVGTISNDDALPALSIDDVALAEGNAGTRTATFTVTLSGATALTATVSWATANGTATAGSDYLAASGTLTFSPGTTSQPVSVTVNGDTTVEPSETFSVNLSTPVNASLADATGLGTITNDDGSTVDLGTPAKSVGAGPITAGGPVAYTITLTNSGGATQADNPGHELVDVLPAELTSVSASAGSGVAVVAGNTVSWDGSIAAGGSVTIRIDAAVKSTVAAGTVITNQASVSYDADANGSNETTVLSDDPAVGGASDPTRFTLEAVQLRFHTLQPCRLVDTRLANGPLGGPALVAGQSRAFAVTGVCGVPTTAVALSLNVTVVAPAGTGHVTLFPGGTTMPLASTLNYATGRTRANNAILPLGGGGTLSVFTTHATQIVIDVAGWFE